MIKHLPELPKEGSIVYVDFGKPSVNDRCQFTDGSFIPDSFNTKLYNDDFNPVRWFYLDEYTKYFKSLYITCYQISFDNAENIEHIKQIEYITNVLSQTEDACRDIRMCCPTGIDIQGNINDMENNLYELKHKIENTIKS